MKINKGTREICSNILSSINNIEIELKNIKQKMGQCKISPANVCESEIIIANIAKQVEYILEKCNISN